VFCFLLRRFYILHQCGSQSSMPECVHIRRGRRANIRGRRGWGQIIRPGPDSCCEITNARGPTECGSALLGSSYLLHATARAWVWTRHGPARRGGRRLGSSSDSGDRYGSYHNRSRGCDRRCPQRASGPFPQKLEGFISAVGGEPGAAWSFSWPLVESRREGGCGGVGSRRSVLAARPRRPAVSPGLDSSVPARRPRLGAYDAGTPGEGGCRTRLDDTTELWFGEGRVQPVNGGAAFEGTSRPVAGWTCFPSNVACFTAERGSASPPRASVSGPPAPPRGGCGRR